LANVAYARQLRTRTERATQAKPAIREAFTDIKQQEFIEFILEKYVEDGVTELAKSKMNSLVTLKYDNVHDAMSVLGSTSVIKETFVGFQKYLYL
jgi:type I restriction enzyme R subunit